MSVGNIIVLSGVMYLVLWGTGVGHGIKWAFHNCGCVVKHGIKACKAKTAALVAQPLNKQDR